MLACKYDNGLTREVAMENIIYFSTLSLALLCSSVMATQPIIEEINVTFDDQKRIASDGNNCECQKEIPGDMSLQVRVMDALPNEKYERVHFCIAKGIVVLIGDLPPEMTQDAVRRVQAVDGVKKVFYEPSTIAIGNSANIDANGTALTASIKGQMQLNFNINASNYTVTSVGKVVYIAGVVTSASERDSLLKILNNEKGVSKVKLFLIKGY